MIKPLLACPSVLTCSWWLREALKWLEWGLVWRKVMTRLLLMLGVAQRFSLWAGRGFWLVIVEKSIVGLRHRAVETPLRVFWCWEGDGVGGVGGWSWRLVMWGSGGVGEGLWLHTVIRYRHPLTINREQAPPHSLFDVTADGADSVGAESSAESESVRWNKKEMGDMIFKKRKGVLSVNYSLCKIWQVHISESKMTREKLLTSCLYRPDPARISL